MKIKRVMLTFVILISLFLTYTYGRHLEYKNALKIEAKLQNNTAKLNEHLLKLLKEENYKNAMQILKDNLEVTQTMSELNDAESSKLSYFDSLKLFILPDFMYDKDEHEELNMGNDN